MKLYGYWRSSCSYRVRIALGLKGIPFENHPVHLRKGEQVAESFLEKNPMGQVPALVLDDGRILAQSMAIFDYLEARYPRPRLFPADPYARARVVQLCEIVNAGIQPLQNHSVLRRLSELGVDAKAFAREMIESGLVRLEREVAGTAGRYAYADDVTAVDALIVPQMYNARRFAADLSKCPTLVRVDEAAGELAAFRGAHPDAQPDRE